jgi:hypothetical protein
VKEKFAFEAEMYASLSCLPLAAKMAFDTVGLKISRAQWQALDAGERRKLCEMRTDSEAERQHFSAFAIETVQRRCGETLKALSDEKRAATVPPEELAPELAEKAKSLGYSLTPARWKSLDYDQRYALIKFGGHDFKPKKFAAALAEFLG